MPSGEVEARAAALRWEAMRAVRDAVYRALEPRRASREFSAFTEMRVTLAADGEVRKLLDTMSDEDWRGFLLVSEVYLETLNGEGAALEASGAAERPLGPEGGRLVVLVERTGHPRCERCWIHRPTVGSVEGHPTICDRCAAALPEGFVLTA